MSEKRRQLYQQIIRGGFDDNATADGIAIAVEYSKLTAEQRRVFDSKFEQIKRGVPIDEVLRDL